MTISSEVRKAGPYSANGSNKNFAFTFKCFNNTDVRVVLTNSLGVESDLVLDSDYSVTLNYDQNVSAGGTIITTIAYATGNKITLVGDVDFTQETDITNGGGFYPEVIENALDKLTMQMQQLKESVGRAAKVDISSGETGEDLISSINETAGEAAASAASAAEQVVLAAAQVTLAQGIYDEFDDRYLGAKSTNPTVDNDGNALLTGALYWNTATSKLRIYSGVAWVDSATATPASFTNNLFNGNGSTTAFTLSTAPASLSSVFVFIGGTAQRPSIDYTIAGTTLTFTTAPTSGTNNISAFVASTVAAGLPDDLSVSTAKIQNGAVTPAKLSTGGPYWNTSGDLTVSSNSIYQNWTGNVYGSFKQNNGTVQSAYALNASQMEVRCITNHPLAFLTNNIERMRIDASGQLKTQVTSGSAVMDTYGCRAWVNFNGTGTVAIRASGNISSITDNGTGDYTVNFTTAMPDVNYAVNVSSGNDGTAPSATLCTTAVNAYTTTSIRLYTGDNSNDTYIDQKYVNVSVFR